MNKFKFIAILVISFALSTFAQPYRESVYNNIGWYGYFGDHKIAKKWSIHTEYQFRRTDFITNWQQSLARFGINYHLSDNVMFTIGYAQAQTFTYGILPIAKKNSDNQDQSFPENRIYQALLLKNNTGIFEINHRMMFEQRFLGNVYDTKNNRIENKSNFVMRFRYRFRIAMPIQGNTMDNNEFYLHAFDEILIGAGENVKNNIFDQNRFQLGIGYKLNKNCKIELGFLNQVVQKPTTYKSTNLPVFEYNNGLLLGITYNIDFTEFKKKEEAQK